MSLTDEAISRIRELVRSGRFPTGAKLPAEHELSVELGRVWRGMTDNDAAHGGALIHVRTSERWLHEHPAPA